MKKLLLLVIAMFLILSLFSCEPLETSYKGQEENKYLDLLIEAIRDEDKERIKSVFAENVVNEADDFDRDITELLDYIEGELEPVTEFPLMRSDTYRGPGEHTVTCQGTYVGVSSKGKYHFALNLCKLDSKDPKNEGITSLYIINDKDLPESEYAYYGDGRDRPGINIGLYDPYSEIISDSNDPGKIANAYLNGLLISLNDSDSGYLKTFLPADMTTKGGAGYLENIDDDIKKLFEYFEGKAKPYTEYKPVEVSKTTIDVPMLQVYDADYETGTVSYDITTTEGAIYRIAMKICIFNEADPFNHGIESICIIKADDNTDLEIPYYGDNKFTPGINIGMENSINKET